MEHILRKEALILFKDDRQVIMPFSQVDSEENEPEFYVINLATNAVETRLYNDGVTPRIVNEMIFWPIRSTASKKQQSAQDTNKDKFRHKEPL